MGQQEIDDFFKEYVFKFMFSDIQREINLAQTGGGNFLAALGLLCYTEVLGKIKQKNFPGGKVGSKANFNAFFNDIGPAYSSFNQSVNVYDVFRCGMAHEYLVKRNCRIAMLKGSESCGIGQIHNGSYYFVVERYFEDFCVACKSLYSTLKAQPNPVLPK